MNIIKDRKKIEIQSVDETSDSFENWIKNYESIERSINISDIHNLTTPIDNDNSILDTKIQVNDKVSKNLISDFSENNFKGIEFINPWKLHSVYPARITEIKQDYVYLEVILDEDIIEEQEYGMNFFEGFDLSVINYFKIKCYERANEQRLVMTDASDSLKREDFPVIDFSHINNNELFF